jgi:hypothetical protein
VPPLVVKVSPVSYVPEIEVSDIAAWSALATVTPYAVETALNLPVSLGVNVAVIVADPAPAIVTAPDEALTLATEEFDDVKAMLPPTEALS